MAKSLKGKGNWTYGKSRSDSGRMGRGANALTSKEARSWKATLERIEAIVARAERAGSTFERQEFISLPAHGRKF